MANVNFYLSQKLGFALLQHRLKVALAESCTGGGMAEEVTAVAGSSVWFDRGFITYSNEAKMELLDVSAESLMRYGAVSEQVAKEMALGTLKNSHADMALSVTGVAGPAGGTKEKPVGMVWFGLADKSGYCAAKMCQFQSGRKQVRSDAIAFALGWLLDKVTQTS